MSFGFQNQPIRKTPTGRIDSRYLDGNDGSDVVPVWNAIPSLSTLIIGTAFSVDLSLSPGLGQPAPLVDPGSPSSQLGFHSVSGDDPVKAGFTLTGTVLANNNVTAFQGTFQLVAIRNG